MTTEQLIGLTLVVILGLPGIALADHRDGQTKSFPGAGKDVPLTMQESIPKNLKGGGVIIPEEGTGKQEGHLPRLTADASCHNPCDDAFKLKAWLKDSSGRGVKAIKVTFSYKLESGVETSEAETDSSGYAHLHLKLTPSVARQDVRVEVTARFTQGDATRVASTWFTPNYN
jgi:hypothetical protein